jgi:excisionase family DNA binding protein
MFTPLEIVGDIARGSTDQKVRGSNPFERAEVSQRLYGNYHFAYCYLLNQLAKQLAKVFSVCGKLAMLCAILIRRIPVIHATFVLARLAAIRSSVCWAGRSRYALVKNWKVAPPSTIKRRNMTTQLLYTVEQAAQVLAISRSSIYRLIVSKEIVTIGIGRSRRVSHQALEGFINAKTKSEYASW